MKSVTWLLLFLILLIIEIITLGLTTVWFAIGALVAFLASIAGAGFVVQVVLFLLTSVVTLIGTRPFAVRYINRHHEKTNIEEVIGKSVEVVDTIDNARGLGKAMLEGQQWMARSRNGDLIPAGARARIVAVEGVKLIVEQGGEENGASVAR